MKKLQQKIEQVRQILIENNESFSLFALVKLKADLKRWDVVVCAEWLPKRKKEAIRIVFDELKKDLTFDEFALISRVVVLDEGELFVEQVRTLFAGNEKLAIFKDQTISDLSVKEIRVLQCESRKECASAALEVEIQQSMESFAQNTKKYTSNIIFFDQDKYNSKNRNEICQNKTSYSNKYHRNINISH
jgi:hypothetical protein